MEVTGNVVDIHRRNIYPAVISIINGKIERIVQIEEAPQVYIIPGLIDAHIHIESSMVTPGAFAMTAVKHGTTGVVSDPHEIANVLGTKGVYFMINDAKKVPLKFWFGAPSCVPATEYESNGARLSHVEIESLMVKDEIKYMAEMMNFPGVIYNDKEVHKKLNIACNLGKPVDGHAPGLTGKKLIKYVEAGISTDHECSTLAEATEKISLGMKILIREGSAARNLDSLKELYNKYPHMLMLCSDDLHPEMLRERHINKLISKLINEGFDLFDVIRSATINPVLHYNLNGGLLQNGQDADFVIVDNLRKMNVIETWIEGKKIFDGGKVLFRYKPEESINNFKCLPISENDIRVEKKADKMRIIEASDGELLTREIIGSSGTGKEVASDTDNDILKIIVKDRYCDFPPSIGFIKGFGLKKGAFASSIAHDSHNIIAVGTNDEDIVRSVNEIVKLKGGLAVYSGEETESLKLNIGGIMTTRSCEDVAFEYEKLNRLVNSMGCPMTSPFMTLSFMALLVIPDLKIGDRGLFDVNKFELISLFIN